MCLPQSTRLTSLTHTNSHARVRCSSSIEFYTGLGADKRDTAGSFSARLLFRTKHTYVRYGQLFS